MSNCAAASADWMSRNLYERCEVVFPVYDTTAKRRLRDEILESYLRDDVKAQLLSADFAQELPNNTLVFDNDDSHAAVRRPAPMLRG